MLLAIATAATLLTAANPAPVFLPASKARYVDYMISVSLVGPGCLVGARNPRTHVLHCLVAKDSNPPDSARGFAPIEYPY